MKLLTLTQQRILYAIKVYWEKNGKSPSISEVADEIGKGASSIQGHLPVLVELGFLEKVSRKHRSLQPTSVAKRFLTVAKMSKGVLIDNAFFTLACYEEDEITFFGDEEITFDFTELKSHKLFDHSTYLFEFNDGEKYKVVPLFAQQLNSL